MDQPTPPSHSVLEKLLSTFVVGNGGIQLTALDFFISALTVNVDMSSGVESGFSVLPMSDKIGTSSNRELGKSARTYDVLFSDGIKRAVLTLHHVFTPLVESGVLKSGSRVLVLQATPKSTKPAKPLGLTKSATYSEEFGVLIQELRLLAQDPAILNDSQLEKVKERLHDLPWATGAVTDFRPQFTGRAHYLHSISDDLSVALPSWTKYATGAKHGLKDGFLPKRKLQLITKWVNIEGRPQDEAINDMDVHLLTDESIPKEECFIYPPDFPSLKEVLNLVLHLKRRRRMWPVKEAVNQAYVDPWTQLVVSHEDVAEAKRLNMDPIEMVRNQAVLNLSIKGGQIPLLGRISAIGRALHFGTLGMKSETYVPWKFEFWITNEGIQLKVVCWNTAAVKFCLAVKNAGIGAIVGITGYRIKLDQLGNAEVSLNNYEDGSNIVELQEDSIRDALQKRTVFHSQIKAAPLVIRDLNLSKIFPEPKLDFETSKSLYFSKKSGEGCSICGVISRVGPLMRSTNFDADYFRFAVSARPSTSFGARENIEFVDSIEESGPSEHSGASAAAAAIRSNSLIALHSRVQTELGNAHQRSAGYGSSIMHSYRWIWLRDSHSFSDICIKAYCNSNSEIAGLVELNRQAMRPGVVAVFTHLRVCSTDKPGRLEGKNSSRPPLYLISSELTSAYFVKTENAIVNQQGMRVMDKLRSMAVNSSMSDSEAGLLISNHPITRALLFQSVAVRIFEMSNLSFKPKIFLGHAASSEPWPARSSLVRPDSVRDLIFLLSSGLGDSGPGVPRLEPNEVDLLKKSNLHVARSLLETNAQSPLGPTVPLSSSAMVGFVNGGGGGSSSVSPMAAVRGLIHLQARESITVIVVGRVARIRGTKKAAPPRARMAPLPAKPINQPAPIAPAPAASVKPSVSSKSRKRGAEAVAAEQVNDDHDAESVEWEGPELPPAPSVAAASLSQGSAGRGAQGNRSHGAQAMAAARVQKEEDEQEIKDLEKRIAALLKGIQTRKMSKIENMTKAQLKASPKLLATKKKIDEVKKLKKKLEKLKREVATVKPIEKETAAKPPPAKKTMLKSTATTAAAAAKTAAAADGKTSKSSAPSAQVFPTPVPLAASAAARPSAVVFKLGEPDVDIGQVYRELHEASNQLEDECCVHNVTSLSEALDNEAEAIKSKDERALEIQRLKSSLAGKKDDPSLVKKVRELENEAARDFEGERRFGFDAQHKLPFPLHVLTIAGADHGANGKENYLDVLLHPSALLPHAPSLRRPTENRCLSTEALRDFFPPSAPSSTDASSLKEFEEWAARKEPSSSLSSSATTWDTSKKFAFVLEVTNRSLELPLSDPTSVSISSIASPGRASDTTTTSTLKPLSVTRTRMASVRVVAIYEA